MSTVEFAILGAGALGSILGAHLARAGHSVAVLAREPRASEVERNGLRLKGLVACTSRVQVIRDAQRLRQADVLIVATKTPGTAAALQPLRAAQIRAAFSIQNGLLKNDLLAEAFGGSRVLGALANMSGERLAGGEILFTRNEGIFLGELSSQASARAYPIAAAIDASGVRASATTQIQSLEWTKFCVWLGLAGVSLTTRALTWRYLCDPDSALVVARLVREAGALAHASGIEPSDESILPVATLCSVDESDAVEAVMRVGARFRASAPEHRMSCLQDLEAGRALEVEETFGDAHRRAVRLGLTLPLIDTFYRLAAAADRGQRS
jgi:2-dehydropantoate 2-reductase